MAHRIPGILQKKHMGIEDFRLSIDDLKSWLKSIDNRQSTISLHESSSRLFFKTVKAASIWLTFFLASGFVVGFFGGVAFVVVAGCFAVAGFIAEVFLAAAVLVAAMRIPRGSPVGR
jgi:hypothetical protein